MLRVFLLAKQLAAFVPRRKGGCDSELPNTFSDNVICNMEANKAEDNKTVFYGNNETMSEFRPITLTTLDLVRLCVSTVATGVFLSLTLWTFVDMYGRRKAMLDSVQNE